MRGVNLWKDFGGFTIFAHFPHLISHFKTERYFIMKVIGITGSSGSGKSTATKILSEEINAKTINADEIVKEMQKENTKYYKKIIELFGVEIIKEDKTLNRKKLAEIIFKDKVKKEKLNILTFKYVVEEIRKKVKETKEEYVIIDAPLLIESKLNEICDVVIAVISNKEEQLKRICSRDNIEAQEAKIRLNSQKDNDFYKKNADYIVENNGGKIDELVGRIRELV